MFSVLGRFLCCFRWHRELQITGEVATEITDEVATVGPKRSAVVINGIEEAPPLNTSEPLEIVEDIAVHQNTYFDTCNEGAAVSSEGGCPDALQECLNDLEDDTCSGGSLEGQDTEPGNSTTATGGSEGMNCTKHQDPRTKGRKMGCTSSVDKPNISKVLCDITKLAMTTTLSGNIQRCRVEREWGRRCGRLLQKLQGRYNDVYEQNIRHWEFLVLYTQEDAVKGEKIRSLLKAHHNIDTPDTFCSPGHNILDYHEKCVSKCYYVILLVSRALLNNNEMKQMVIYELLTRENRNIYPLYLDRCVEFPEGLNTLSTISEIKERQLIDESDLVSRAKLRRYMNEIDRIDKL
ncbi:unnamed protein product [Meganyctiphanes norvegica]|uniref:Uncharacterized protein n=1 Tax=Meganyctiphanes norvegica TaxID=48144 RepID=A0AAV2RCA8_MEGNR